MITYKIVIYKLKIILTRFYLKRLDQMTFFSVPNGKYFKKRFLKLLNLINRDSLRSLSVKNLK